MKDTLDKEPKRKKSASIKVLMSPELHKAFDRATTELGQTTSAVVRRMIESYLIQNQSDSIVFQEAEAVVQ